MAAEKTRAVSLQKTYAEYGAGHTDRHGDAGRKAEPSWYLQAYRPTSAMAMLAQKPRKMPNAVQSCHLQRCSKGK
jgi:hypothetical protein